MPAVDPLWRWLFLRAVLLGTAVAVASRFGVAWTVLVGMLGAALLGVALARHFAPLRLKVVELARGSEADTDARSSVPQLVRLVGEAEERLAEARRKVELERDDVIGLLQSTSEGILVLGHHQRVELINDAARRLLDPPVDPLGRSLHELVRQGELVEFAEALRRGEGPAPLQLRVGDESGRRWLHVSGTLVPGERLRTRAVVVLHDLTDLRHLESVRTDFVANVTHEMRSPLSSILGYAETLAMDERLASEESQDFLERILRNTRRLDDIIRDLIELSRLEHANAPETKKTDVSALLHEIAADFADQARGKGVALTCELERLPGPLDLDASLVRQAISNLVDNAIKYTPEGGRVVLAAGWGDGPATPRLILSVRDTGIGIPPEHQNRIFERFYRVDTARSRALGGTGLGLAIVKHVAALHGGTVGLESVAGEGSLFALFLPCPPPSSP